MDAYTKIIAALTMWLQRRTGDWPVTKKVLVAFGGLGAVGGIALLFIGIGLALTANAALSARAMAVTAQSVTEAETAVRTAQGRLKDYIISPNEDTKTKVRKEIQVAKTALDRVIEDVDGTELSNGAQEVEKRVDTLAENFARIVVAQEKIEKSAGAKLDRLGPVIGARLESMVEKSFAGRNYVAANRSATALNDYSEARIDVNAYRSTSDQAVIESAKLHLLRLEESMNAVFEVVDGTPLSDEADKVIVDVVEYERALADLDELMSSRDADVTELVLAIGPAFDADARQLHQDVTYLAAQAMSSARALFATMLAILVCVLLVGAVTVVTAVIVSRELISTPIEDMTGLMRRLAAGEQNVVIAENDRKDEIGDMTRAVLIFQKNAQEIEAQRAAADAAQKREYELRARREEERMAERQRAEEEKRAALAELADSFETSVKSVAAAVSAAARQIEADARQVASAANDSARVSAEVATAAHQSSQNALAVANASEEMAHSIAEVSSQVVESSAKSQNAARLARSTDSIVVGLAEDASKIGEVVELINEIAEQTNLLALNATIEAARAGESGRGFAVVAGEIKALASQTSAATTQIAERVGGIQTVSREAIKAIESIALSIGDIDGIAAAVASAVEEQSVTTSEIASNTQQAADGSQLVARNIERVREGITETGTAAEQSLAAASQLSDQAEMLQSEVEAFMMRVRAA